MRRAEMSMRRLASNDGSAAGHVYSPILKMECGGEKIQDRDSIAFSDIGCL
jgi:hypothetical protein